MAAVVGRKRHRDLAKVYTGRTHQKEFRYGNITESLDPTALSLPRKSWANVIFCASACYLQYLHSTESVKKTDYTQGGTRKEARHCEMRRSAGKARARGTLQHVTENRCVVCLLTLWLSKTLSHADCARVLSADRNTSYQPALSRASTACSACAAPPVAALLPS